MLLKCKYKLKPDASQKVIMADWLDMARRQYNYRLGERMGWFEATRTPINACPLNVSVVPDVAFGQFIQVLKYVAWKRGKHVIKVNPRGTSQNCWNCLNEVCKTLKERWHSCSCGQELDRDYNSALLIKKIGLLIQQEEDITSSGIGKKIQVSGKNPALHCIAVNVGSMSRIKNARLKLKCSRLQ